MISSNLLCLAILSLGYANADKACANIDTVVEAAREHKVEEEILLSLIYEESTWKVRSKSHKGACGLTQVVPKWSISGYTCKDLLDPEKSIFEGAKHLSFWYYDYARGKSYTVALCGYNRGYRCKKPGINKERGSPRRGERGM